MKSEVIANPRAERVRRVSELADRKGRKRSGRFMVEGPQSVRELLSWHPDIVEDLYVEVVSAEPDAAFITPTVAQMAGKSMQAGTYVHKVTHAVMQHMSSDAQGVLAVADMRAFLDSAVIDGDSDERTMVAAFWQVRAPGNAGTVIRAADAAGCDVVVFVDDCVDMLNPKVIRSTTGSLFHIPVIAMGTNDFFDWMKEQGLDVWAADVYGTRKRKPERLPDVLDAMRGEEHRKDGYAVLFGNEARGLNGKTLEQCQRIVSIPMYGKAESLNLATSAAIILMSLAFTR
mgnify:CR=1 FL=1